MIQLQTKKLFSSCGLNAAWGVFSPVKTIQKNSNCTINIVKYQKNITSTITNPHQTLIAHFLFCQFSTAVMRSTFKCLKPLRVPTEPSLCCVHKPLDRLRKAHSSFQTAETLFTTNESEVQSHKAFAVADLRWWKPKRERQWPFKFKGLSIKRNNHLLWW